MDLRQTWRQVRTIAAKFSGISITTYASSISYFTFLSLVPVLAVCISLLSSVGLGEQETTTFLVAIIPDALDEIATSIISEAYRNSGAAFSISTLTLLWTASKGARALRAGLNATFAQEEVRSAPQVMVISVVAGLLLDVLLAATIYLVFSTSVRRMLTGLALRSELLGPDPIMPLLEVIAVGIGVVSLAACYAFLPAGTRRLVSQLPGAVAATLACGLLSVGFHIYVDHFSNFTVLYGSLAAIMLFLFWMYLMSTVILAGGFLNRIIADLRAENARLRRSGPSGLSHI